MRIPKGLKIGKAIEDDVCMRGGNRVGLPHAQIFVRCIKCGDTIALVPDGSMSDNNAVIDSVSNKYAQEIFERHGWKLGRKPLCPICK